MNRALTVVQLLPKLDVGGVERGTLQIAQALVHAGHRAIVVSAPGRLVSELEASGAEHVALAIGAKRLSSLRHVRTLADFLRRERVDVVHARSRLPAWLGALALRLLPRASRPAWVTTVHGPYTVNRYSRIMTSGERVIAISEFIRDYICSNYPQVAADRVVVIPRGVERDRYAAGFVPSAAWLARWQQDHPTLVDVPLLILPGRLTRWKGQLEFIDVIAELRRRDVRVHGLIVGAAELRREHYAEELRRRVVGLALQRDVSFLGQRNDLRELLSIARIACSLTIEPEGFGRTTIESLSLGTPVVGYDHGGTGEILRAVYPQGLVPLRAVGAAVDRIAALLTQPVAVPRDHPYTVERLQQATLAVYQSLADVSTRDQSE